jgi:transcriptional regulator with XRE-family HTH domain
MVGVKGVQDSQSWRGLLATISSDNKEKQRIIEELGITPITLTRWVNGESAPRAQNLRHLLTILPQYREQLVQLLQEEKGVGDLTQFFQEESEKDIPAWSTCDLILQQALKHLDPNRVGNRVLVSDTEIVVPDWNVGAEYPLKALRQELLDAQKERVTCFREICLQVRSANPSTLQTSETSLLEDEYRQWPVSSDVISFFKLNLEWIQTLFQRRMY